jgi:neurotrimin
VILYCYIAHAAARPKSTTATTKYVFEHRIQNEMFRLNVKHHQAGKSCRLELARLVSLLFKLLVLANLHHQLRTLIISPTQTTVHQSSKSIDATDHHHRHPDNSINAHNLALLAAVECVAHDQFARTRQPTTNHDHDHNHTTPKDDHDEHKPEVRQPPHHQHSTQGGAITARNLVLIQQQPQQAEQPDFIEPIGNHTVAVGRDAQLACKISNLGNYRTAWLRVEDKGILTIHNNIITRNYRFGLLTPDDGEQSFVLTIRNVQPSDRGGYMCQINSVPMKYAVGYLDVLTPPVFDEVPASSSGGDGAGSPESAATDSAEQQQQDRQQQPKTTNSSHVSVVEGSSVTLSCSAQGHPKPSIAWRREDGRPIMLNGLLGGEDATDPVGAPVEIKDTNSLTFASVNRLNSGAYLCIASNGVQPSASKRQLLDVKYSPTITVPQTEIAGWLGEREARLECLADLNPAGTYHWVKLATSTTNTDRRPMVANQEDDLWLIEHDELMPSDKFDIVIKQINSEKVRMILVIRHVDKQDFSWYKCIAKNGLGLQSSFVRFYESSPGHSAATTTTTSASSSFSFKNIIRIRDFVGGGGGDNNGHTNRQQQQDDNKLNLPQNDDSRLSFQRSSSSSSSAASHAPASPIDFTSHLNLVPARWGVLFMLFYNCQFATLLSLVMIASLLNLHTVTRALVLEPT